MKWFLFLLLTIFSATAFSQADTTTPVYKRFPTLPPLNLVLSDSMTKYTTEDIPKRKPVLIMFFSPDCEHCQHETQELVANKDSFKNVHIIMVSTYPYYRIRAFAESYGLTKMNNVVMAKDPNYFLLTFYSIHNFPFVAMYNKKGGLVGTLEGSKPIEKVIEALKNN